METENLHKRILELDAKAYALETLVRMAFAHIAPNQTKTIIHAARKEAETSHRLDGNTVNMAVALLDNLSHLFSQHEALIDKTLNP